MASGISANKLELLQIADAVAREKGIEMDIVLSAMADAIQKAAKARYGQENDIRVDIDPKTGETTPHLSSVRRIAVSRDKATGKEVVDEQQWPVHRVTFTSAALLDQVAAFPQVVNLGPDGKGRVVAGGAEAAAATPRQDAAGALPEAKRQRC